MQANDRRFRQRYDASPLKLHIRRINWLGMAGKAEEAIARDFALGGIGIITRHKLKAGKQLLLSIESNDHRLEAIPATVLRCDPQGTEFVCAVKFAMGQVPELASRGAYTVLQRLESTLRATSPV